MNLYDVTFLGQYTKDTVVSAARTRSELVAAEVVLTHRDGVSVYAERQYHGAGSFPEKRVGRSRRGGTCLAAYVARRLASSAAQATVWAPGVTSLKMKAESPSRSEVRKVQDLMRRHGGS